MNNLFSNICDEPLVIPFKKIKIKGEIGRGSYGRVFEIECGKAHYAAKELHAALAGYGDGGGGVGNIKANFIRECSIWSQLYHPCIVQFLGKHMHACIM